MRILRFIISVAVLVAPRALTGQVVTFGYPGDSVLSVVVGDSSEIPLTISGATGGVSQYTITLFVDTARVQLVRADSAPGSPLPAPTLTPVAADQWTLDYSGSGTISTLFTLANLSFRMQPSAVQGSYVSLKVTNFKDQAGLDLLPAHRTGVLDVCQANSYWGDVTGEHAVNSRDALVALTASVGQPAGGFDLSFADVDADSLVTSRDALIILSHSVRLYTGSPRVGKARTDRCAPLRPVPDDLFYFRSNKLYQIAAGDTLPGLFALPVVPYDGLRVTWSPDGQRVLFSAFTSPFYYEVMSSASPFTTVDTLTRTLSTDWGADWSPDGTRIAFVSDRAGPAAVFVMNADGTNQNQVTFGMSAHASRAVSWSPDGQRIAFVGDSVGLSRWGIWTVEPDNDLITTEILADSLLHDPRDIVFTPAGDSILYARGSTTEVYLVPAAGGTPVRASALGGGSDYPGASTQGPAFRTYFDSRYDLVLRQSSGGRHLRLRRNESQYRLSFRRGSVYVSTVTASPQSQTVALSLPTFSATAAVKNSDNSDNTTILLDWISSDPTKVSVTPTGLQTADITGLGTGTYSVVVTAGGWRSDTIQVTVNP